MVNDMSVRVERWLGAVRGRDLYGPIGQLVPGAGAYIPYPAPLWITSFNGGGLSTSCGFPVETVEKAVETVDKFCPGRAPSLAKNPL